MKTLIVFAIIGACMVYGSPARSSGYGGGSKKCKTIYKTTYDTEYKKEKVCNDYCETKYKNDCHSYQDEVCQTKYHDHCEPQKEYKCHDEYTTKKVPYQDEVCEKKKVCKGYGGCVYKNQCHYVTRYNVKKVPHEVCDYVYHDVCKKVPKKDCHYVTKQKCDKVPYEDCYPKCDYVSKPYKVPRKQPVKVCYNGYKWV